MKIVTAAEMREIDRLTTEKHNIPSLTLMENAGTAVARFVLRKYSDAKRIIVLCGKGNNGGDGFVAARKLREAGKQVRTVLLAAVEDVKGDAQKMLRLMAAAPTCIREPQQADALGDLTREADLIVDAIFGTGFRPPLPELVSKTIELIGKTHAPVVSVDVPSGIDSDSFALEQPQACRSSAVVTFTAPKPAIVFGAITSGPILVADIGSPNDLIRSNLGIEWNNPSHILCEARRLNSNKGLYGHALIIGGSRGKSGAPTMASMAALRIGAGLVTCAVPTSILPIIAGSIPELMTEALDETASGAVSSSALRESELTRILERKNVVGLGPGLGHNPETVTATRSFVRGCSLPLVIDADGLNAFEGATDLLNGAERPLVLTPHPGEMARLAGCTVREVEANRIEVARKFAQKHSLVLILKGWRTLIADPQGRVWVNTTGNPGLAKGGSGDVLTGMVAGMIAQYPKQIVEAARAAVFLHGLAADCTLENQTERTMLATDVIAALVEAFRLVQRPDEFIWIQGGAQRR
ncbi:MAG TPA: NAD(P)H-hydrate dehydratase [Terriglobales bacterium]|nr:NAD(P)H-hydrate dehydratase [Terriglobales bacterium]